MDRNTEAALHRRKLGRVDRVTANGRIEDLIRQVKARPSGERGEYSITVGGMEYGPPEIDELARELGIQD
jgi:hypothetical protein